MAGYEFVSCRRHGDQRLMKGPATGPIATSFSKIVSILLSKSDCPNADTSLCYPFLSFVCKGVVTQALAHQTHLWSFVPWEAVEMKGNHRAMFTEEPSA